MTAAVRVVRGHTPRCGAGEDQTEQFLAVVAVIALGQLDDELPLLGVEMIGQLEVHGRVSVHRDHPADADTGAQTDSRNRRRRP